MTQVFPGRYTAQVDRDFVVFIIGARINRWWLPHKWLPVAFAMPRMLRLLRRDKSLGMLGTEEFVRLFPLTTMMVSYWESFEKLERFASDKTLPHAASWAKFMRDVGADGSVGIYHETYQVKKGQYECIYGNMPRFGLASAYGHVPVGGKRETARGRIEGS